MGFTQFLRRNLGLKIFCVALSIFLWAWVRYMQAPLTGESKSQTSIYLPIVYQNEKKGLTLNKAPDKVIITVKGPPNLIDTIEQDQFKAFVDLEDTDEGQSWADISVRIPPGYTLIDIQPQKANLFLEKFEKRQFKIKLDIRGEPKQGYFAGTPLFEPEEVEISGAQSTLKRIKEVVLPLNVHNRDRDLIQLVQPEPRDSDNKFVLVKVTPEFVKVDLPVRANTRTETLPIRPTIIGNPAKKFRIDYIELEPPIATVLFTGEGGVYSEVLNTEPIDIKKQKSLLEKDVSIIQPSGGSLVGNKSVKVKIYFCREEK